MEKFLLPIAATGFTVAFLHAAIPTIGCRSCSQVHQATGKVTKVDKSKSAVTIAHDPVASMKWPSMAMGFKVKDKALLEKLKPGGKGRVQLHPAGKRLSGHRSEIELRGTS